MRDYADVVLVDIVEGLPQGKALDLMQIGPLLGFDTHLTGATPTTDTAGSDVVVITSGIARKPGMSRDDLLRTNMGIVESVTKQVVSRLARRDHHRRLQSARRDVPCRVRRGRFPARARDRHGRRARLGPLPHVHRHGSSTSRSRMSPRWCSAVTATRWCRCPRYSTVAGIPITELIAGRARRGDRGAHRERRRRDRRICSRPAAPTTRRARRSCEMVDSIVLDKKRILPCSVLLQGEYGINDLYVGVPVKLGANGVEQDHRAQADR